MKNGVPVRNQRFHEENGATIFYGIILLLAMFFWKIVLIVSVGIIAFLLLVGFVVNFNQGAKLFEKQEALRRKKHEQFRNTLNRETNL